MKSIPAALAETFTAVEANVSTLLAGVETIIAELEGGEADERLRTTMTDFMAANGEVPASLPAALEATRAEFARTAGLFVAETDIQGNDAPVNFFATVHKFIVQFGRAVKRREVAMAEAEERAERRRRQEVARQAKASAAEAAAAAKAAASVVGSVLDFDDDAHSGGMAPELVDATPDEATPDPPPRRSLGGDGVNQLPVRRPRPVAGDALAPDLGLRLGSKHMSFNVSANASHGGGGKRRKWLNRTGSGQLEGEEGARERRKAMEEELVRALAPHSILAASMCRRASSPGDEDVLETSMAIATEATTCAESRRCPSCGKIYAPGSLHEDVDKHIDSCLHTATGQPTLSRGERQCGMCNQVFSRGAAAHLVEEHLGDCPFDDDDDDDDDDDTSDSFDDSAVFRLGDGPMAMVA